MILVVGATGQLGTLVVRRLRAQGRPVRALVRPGGRVQPLSDAGAELVSGDLRDRASLAAAMSGVDAVVATANSVVPSRTGDSAGALARGYADLVGLAADAGVSRFVLASVPVTGVDEEVPELRLKRLVERRLQDSGLSHLSLRLAPFTEVWLALVGSSLPERGETNGTLQRPYPFLRRFRRLSGRTIEDRGLLMHPGPAARRNAFISVGDAADALVASVDATVGGAVEVGGPEILSWTDVASRFADVLGRPVRTAGVPATTYALAQRVMAPVAPAAANVMGLNLMMATNDTAWDSAKATADLGLGRLRTVHEVLSAKAALPA
jgi:uncharacterized protein YbjT (DUF2867 family)